MLLEVLESGTILYVMLASAAAASRTAFRAAADTGSAAGTPEASAAPAPSVESAALRPDSSLPASVFSK